MKKIFILIFIVGLLFVSCSDPEGSKEFLESQGYANIEITGYDFLASGKGDWNADLCETIISVPFFIITFLCKFFFGNWNRLWWRKK